LPRVHVVLERFPPGANFLDAANPSPSQMDGPDIPFALREPHRAARIMDGNIDEERFRYPPAGGAADGR
jgi:hypothetical protein